MVQFSFLNRVYAPPPPTLCHDWLCPAGDAQHQPVPRRRRCRCGCGGWPSAILEAAAAADARSSNCATTCTKVPSPTPHGDSNASASSSAVNYVAPHSKSPPRRLGQARLRRRSTGLSVWQCPGSEPTSARHECGTGHRSFLNKFSTRSRLQCTRDVADRILVSITSRTLF